jgi:CBS-domain-containing membrane protein
MNAEPTTEEALAKAMEELDAHKTEIDRLLNEQRAFVERIRELEAQLASKD